MSHTCPTCGGPTVAVPQRKEWWCPRCYVPELCELPFQVTPAEAHGLVRDMVGIAGSQKAAAARLGISPQHLCDVLRGRREVSGAVAERLGLMRTTVYVQRLPAARTQMDEADETEAEWLSRLPGATG